VTHVVFEICILGLFVSVANSILSFTIFISYITCIIVILSVMVALKHLSIL